MFDRERDDLDLVSAVGLRRREVSRERMQKFEGYMAEIFEALDGEPILLEGLRSLDS